MLTFPGFVADDSSMRPLRTLLSRRGYWAQPWSLGRNLGPTRQVLDGMSKRLTELYAGSGRPVSLIGQSLGGVYARDLARRHPDMVRGVITLGSPFRLDRREHNSHRTNTGDLFAATRLAQPGVRAARPGEPAAPAPGASDRDLLPHRRCRAMALVPGTRRAAEREPRGRQQPLRPRRPPRRRGHHSRPRRPARRPMAAVSPAYHPGPPNLTHRRRRGAHMTSRVHANGIDIAFETFGSAEHPPCC